ncbi:hypothetical protein ACLOJK_017899 [Asimina triloba]
MDRRKPAQTQEEAESIPSRRAPSVLPPDPSSSYQLSISKSQNSPARPPAQILKFLSENPSPRNPLLLSSASSIQLMAESDPAPSPLSLVHSQSLKERESAADKLEDRGRICKIGGRSWILKLRSTVMHVDFVLRFLVLVSLGIWMELTELKKTLNVEVEQLRTEFQELKTTLQQQQDDVTTSLKNLGMQDMSDVESLKPVEVENANEVQVPVPKENAHAYLVLRHGCHDQRLLVAAAKKIVKSFREMTKNAADKLMYLRKGVLQPLLELMWV